MYTAIFTKSTLNMYKQYKPYTYSIYLNTDPELSDEDKRGLNSYDIKMQSYKKKVFYLHVLFYMPFIFIHIGT